MKDKQLALTMPSFYFCVYPLKTKFNTEKLTDRDKLVSTSYGIVRRWYDIEAILSTFLGIFPEHFLF